jgi:hypothetical protein
MSVGVMKDYKRRDLHASHTLGWSWKTYMCAGRAGIAGIASIAGIPNLKFGQVIPAHVPVDCASNLNEVERRNNEAWQYTIQSGGGTRLGASNRRKHGVKW